MVVQQLEAARWKKDRNNKTNQTNKKQSEKCHFSLFSFIIYTSSFYRNIITIVMLEPYFNIQFCMKIYKNKVGSSL